LPADAVLGDHSGVNAEPKHHSELLEAMGGTRGVAESGLPGIAYVTAYTIDGQDLELSLWIAIGVAAVLTAMRLWRRETLQFAIAGLVGVGIAAFITSRTGRAEDFFLPGLLLNAAYAAAYLISIVVRWPLIGVIVGPLLGDGMSWRHSGERVRLYSRASWIWVAAFCARLAVQLPLYFAGSVVALGVVRTAMGVPVFALAVWFTYVVLRSGGGLTPLNTE
jgi:hypothetical protein